MGVKIDTLKCIGCGACTFVCPVGVLEVVDMKCRVKEGCISCGKCVIECPWEAITLEKPAKEGQPGPQQIPPGKQSRKRQHGRHHVAPGNPARKGRHGHHH